jgi:hypothetical protein
MTIILQTKATEHTIQNKLFHIPNHRSEESCSEIHGHRIGSVTVPMEELRYLSVWPTL